MLIPTAQIFYYGPPGFTVTKDKMPQKKNIWEDLEERLKNV